MNPSPLTPRPMTTKCRAAAARSGPFACVVLALCAALLQGCASEPAKPAPDPTLTEEASRMKVGPKERAEFDAAMKAMAANEHEKSIALLEGLAQALPGNPIPHINLALVYRKMDQLEKAEKSLKTALEIAPDHPVASHEMALLYRKSGRFQEARELYEKILRQHPNFNLAHRNLGILCDLYLQDYACALDHYTRYGAEHPDDKQLAIWIADVQRRAGK